MLASCEETRRKAQQECAQARNRCNAAGRIAAERNMDLGLAPTSVAVIAAAEFILRVPLKGFAAASAEVHSVHIHRRLVACVSRA